MPNDYGDPCEEIGLHGGQHAFGLGLGLAGLGLVWPGLALPGLARLGWVVPDAGSSNARS